MKKQSAVVLFVFLLTQSSFAGVVAEVVFNPGFMSHFAAATHVQVEENGQVNLKRAEESSLVAKLSAQAMKNLKMLIAAIPEKAELVLDDPNSKECMDGPSTSYKVVKSNGTEVMVALNSGCRMSHIQVDGMQQSVDTIESMLRGLHALAQLVQK